MELTDIDPGSSPLTRGTPALDLETSGSRRFIPAYAGNSLHIGVWRQVQKRFIPAYAGNSQARLKKKRLISVHPRLRGELPLEKPCQRARSGSSPLTRGTLTRYAEMRWQIRFIPAYAGNSLKQGIEHLTNSSKDFLSGKYAKNPETVLNHFKNSSLD